MAAPASAPHRSLISSFQAPISSQLLLVPQMRFPLLPCARCRCCRPTPRRSLPGVRCATAEKPPVPAEVSSAAKLRSEVLSPFRSVRMFFYLAFVASGTLGGLITATKILPSLRSSSGSGDLSKVLKDLAIDVGAVLIFALLYRAENNSRNLQLAKLTREENLSKLKLRIDENRIVSVGELRGAARLVIVAGPTEFLAESFNRSRPFVTDLVDRGILVVPFAIDGAAPSFQYEENDAEPDGDGRRRRLWQLTPVYTSDWISWLDEQKKLANVAPDSPVYLSLRMDGRVRGSGVGYPPWRAFVAQLPPVKGMWLGLLDGMDGRVL